MAGRRSNRSYAALRNGLVDREIVGAGIRNSRVIAAMRTTPRHEFIRPSQRRNAYFDMALPIGAGQTISPPFVVAFMTAQLDPQPTDRVLEIGTGSGYQAAVLSGLVADVYSIEIVELLGRRAAATLKRLNDMNVHTRIGDGFLGWPEEAPFDKIIVTCSPEDVPQPLVEQLADGGRMIVPLGERFQQTLFVLTKVGGKLRREALEATFFVPMTGQAERRRMVLPNGPFSALVHGDFEAMVGETSAPLGWYYVRQGKVEQRTDASESNHCVVFSNTTPGRNAHAMQAFGVDGRAIDALEVSLWVHGHRLVAGRSAAEQAGALLAFYGDNRQPVGQGGLGPWRGTFDWKRVRQRIRVPPRARLAVIALGLLGGTGTVCFDQVEVHPSGPRRAGAVSTPARTNRPSHGQNTGPDNRRITGP